MSDYGGVFIQKILPNIRVGEQIPKPNKAEGTVILQVSKISFDYRIGKLNKKTVSFKEVEHAVCAIYELGEINRAWYKKHFPKESSHFPCNFTTIGGILQKAGIARYSRGKYIKIIH